MKIQLNYQIRDEELVECSKVRVDLLNENKNIEKFDNHAYSLRMGFDICGLHR